MAQKGVYPYDYMDRFDKFNETELPTKEEFYSILNNEHITDEDYCHAQKCVEYILSYKRWASTTTYTLNLTFFYWPTTYSKTSGKHVLEYYKLRSMSLFHISRFVMGCYA